MERPNIVWWSIDSVRRDRCSGYGYSRPTTPNLSSIGEQLLGRSHGTWTLPSTASMLTLREVNEHGLTNQGDQLESGSETVPQRLQSVGYRTVGLAANPWVSRGSGLDIGFNQFYNIDEDRNLLREVGWKDALRFIIGVRKQGGGFTTQPVKHPTDWLMLSLAKKYLNGTSSEEPTFMYLHTKGVHSVNGDFLAPPAWRGSITPNETLDDRYDDLLAWVDHLWPRLETALEEDTIVVVTSDHGELLGEDGHVGHDYEHPLLYEVPLWVRGIDTNRLEEETSHIEIMSHILSSLELSTELCEITTQTAGESNLSKQAEQKLTALGYK